MSHWPLSAGHCDSNSSRTHTPAITCAEACLFLVAADKPEPWLFTAYRAFAGLLNCLVWLLLLAVVGMLMFMLLWLGGSLAVNAAITQGTK